MREVQLASARLREARKAASINNLMSISNEDAAQRAVSANPYEVICGRAHKEDRIHTVL